MGKGRGVSNSEILENDGMETTKRGREQGNGLNLGVLHFRLRKIQMGVRLPFHGRPGISGNTDPQASVHHLRSASLPGKRHSDKCFQPREEGQSVRQGLQEPGASKGKRRVNYN